MARWRAKGRGAKYWFTLPNKKFAIRWAGKGGLIRKMGSKKLEKVI